MNRRRRSATFQFLLVRLPLLLFGIWTLFPLYWMARTSLMPDTHNQIVPLQYVPWPLTFQYYQQAWGALSLGQLFLNSSLVALGGCGLALIFAVPSAYALARFRFRLKPALILGLAGTQLIPAVLIIIPAFVLFTQLRLVDNLLSLVLADGILFVPFSALLLKQFYEQIPPDLDEAAMVDGCTRLGALVRVVLPITLPGLVAVTIFNFINSWNALILPTILISSPARMTLPPGLNTLKDEFIFSWGTHAAGAMISVIPTLILFAIIQKYLIRGLAAGSVKG